MSLWRPIRATGSSKAAHPAITSREIWVDQAEHWGNFWGYTKRWAFGFSCCTTAQTGQTGPCWFDAYLQHCCARCQRPSTATPDRDRGAHAIASYTFHDGCLHRRFRWVQPSFPRPDGADVLLDFDALLNDSPEEQAHLQQLADFIDCMGLVTDFVTFDPVPNELSEEAGLQTTPTQHEASNEAAGDVAHIEPRSRPISPFRSWLPSPPPTDQNMITVAGSSRLMICFPTNITIFAALPAYNNCLD